QPSYDLLLKGGHVIDAKNRIDAVRDVAIAGGRIALVAEKVDPVQARKVVNVAGLYVTPGLVDIHVHLYHRTNPPPGAADESVKPDAFSFRSGVTTMVDAWLGCPRWRGQGGKCNRTTGDGRLRPDYARTQSGHSAAG